MEKFFTVREVADSFNVRVETVKRWIKTGKLDAVKIGRKYCIAANAIAKAVKKYSTAKQPHTKQ